MSEKFIPSLQRGCRFRQLLNNQRGMILPVVLILSAILLSVTFYSVEQFMGDKKFTHEAAGKLMADHLIRLAALEWRESWEAGQTDYKEGLLFYPNGDVYYKVTDESVSEIGLTFYATSKDGQKSLSLMKFDKTQRDMTEKVE
ncbi:competence type IV pilus minor pilin ComGG [Bacillus massiliglaciei]|uniref:competence type IV pilus minor pilin ComGG n=1 Tax=Bacillus massiliglaciei TaxID=1816693 RepID=UPI000DA61C33|nr:competence type IV pilus minor pilin ComGG [Bacillus massiliglaciei]